MERTARPVSRARQHGAVLAVALVLLIVLTLFAVSAMHNAGMEERITGNAQDSAVAFEAAEAAIRAGELLLQQPVLPEFAGADGLYPTPPASDAPRWQWIDWSDPAEVRRYAGFSDAPGSLQRVQAAWFIEQLPLVIGPGESLGSDVPLDEVGFYRVTARGVGIGGKAVATLQTTYKR